MFSVSTSVILVVFFVSQALGQSSTTVSPSPSMTSEQPTKSFSISVSGQTTTLLATTNYIVSTPATSHQNPTPVPSSTISVPSNKVSTSQSPPATPSCFLVSFIAERAWNASLSGSLSALYNKTSEEISTAVKNFFNETNKYKDVEVSEHKYSNKDGVTFVEMKLCLVVKTSDGTFVVAVFIDKVKTGYLFKGFEVRKDSVEFKPLGVEFEDWKAKDCTNCDEGAAGEFTIERKCVPKEWSCQGVKNTMMTKDCVDYCNDSSAGTYTVSAFLILAMGIFFSFSFQ